MNEVLAWWLVLLIAFGVNLLLWSREWKLAAMRPRLGAFLRSPLRPEAMVWLSGIYVMGCGLRAVFPKADVERLALFDTWFSSVFFGRSIATVAELAFAAQWSIVVAGLGYPVLARWVLGAIAVAEVFSWYSVVTTHFLGNCIEESLWGLAFSAVTFALWRSRNQLLALGTAAYVAFMACVDVPMYLGRLKAQLSQGQRYFGFWEGLLDLNERRVVSWSISDWEPEIPWMTLYFTVAVWVSIRLCRFAPRSRLSENG